MNEADKEVLRWFEAARIDDVQTLELMLDEGFWVEARSPGDGMTALMIAAGEGGFEAVALLAGSCEEIDARDEWGNTAALIAAAQGQTRALEHLLALGADERARNRAGLDIDKARARGSRHQTPRPSSWPSS